MHCPQAQAALSLLGPSSNKLRGHCSAANQLPAAAGGQSNSGLRSCHWAALRTVNTQAPDINTHDQKVCNRKGLQVKQISTGNVLETRAICLKVKTKTKVYALLWTGTKTIAYKREEWPGNSTKIQFMFSFRILFYIAPLAVALATHANYLHCQFMESKISQALQQELESKGWF